MYLSLFYQNFIYIVVCFVIINKKEIQSIPYRSISRFTIETAGTADIDSEIKLYISNGLEPIVSLELGRNKQHVYDISRILSEELLG